MSRKIMESLKALRKAKLEESTYQYKDYTIIYSEDDGYWRIKDKDGKWVGNEFVSDTEAEEFIDDVGECDESCDESCDELNETEVTVDGEEVVIHKKDGSEERWEPADYSAQEVLDKFNGIMRHSVGRAWQWLKKVNKKSDPVTESTVDNTIEDTHTETVVTTNDDGSQTVVSDSTNHTENTFIPEPTEVHSEEITVVDEPTEAPVEEPTVCPVCGQDPCVCDSDEDEEFVEESISEDSEIYKLLKGKEFDDYDSVEKLVKDKGYEVTEVYKEGDGFNACFCKEGCEYYVPFALVGDKYVAQLDAGLNEGLGDWIAGKVAKVVARGNGVNARKDLVAKLQDKLGDELVVSVDGDSIKVTPKDGFVIKLDTVVDDGNLKFGDLKAINLDLESLKGAMKEVIDSVATSSSGSSSGTDSSSEDGESSDEVQKAIDLLTKQGYNVNKTEA